ncbi:MAG: phosphoglycerate kinase [Candidatus Kerfeldbacteria bacterium]
MKLRSIRSVSVRGKRVLVRAELNVARDASGRIVDDSRLRSVVPTIKFLRNKGARIIIATHLGRPNGRVVRSLSTRSLVRPLARALNAPVIVAPDSVGKRVRTLVDSMKPKDVVLLENVRFHPGEEQDDHSYAHQLSILADIFVLECFGTAHRKHASVIGVGRYLPSYAGFEFMQEVQELSRLLVRPRRPLVALLGGAKISTKIGLIENLLKHVDALLLGGALANTILKSQGIQIGASLNEPGMVRQVRLMNLTDVRFHIPVDVVVHRKSFRPIVRAVGGVKRGESILDIGPDTVTLFSKIVREAKTIVWNGPMGMFERRPFDRGTCRIAEAVGRARAYTVVGGGETVEALKRSKVEKRIDFISTGGGAMMEFLEGKHLPGVELVREY